MTPEFEKYESEGWFYLSRTGGACDPTDDSLGRGASNTITRFQSAEAREYFIQARTMEARLTHVLWQRDCLIRDVEAAIKKRSLRKRLREIIFKVT